MKRTKKIGRVCASSRPMKRKSNISASKKSLGRKKIMASITDEETPYIRIFLTNLGKYNEGELVGTWVDLPVDDDFESVMEEIGINDQYEEWFITDYESNIPDLEIGEYDNIYDLNEKAEELTGLDEQQFIGVKAFVEIGASLEYAIDHCDDIYVHYDCYTDGDLAASYIEDIGGLSELSKDTLERYFDYDSFGRDMRLEGTYIQDGSTMIELLY